MPVKIEKEIIDTADEFDDDDDDLTTAGPWSTMGAMTITATPRRR